MIVIRSPADPPGVKVTVDELSDILGPDGDTVIDRFTVPLKPFRLARERVTFPEEERGILIVDALAVSEKSGVSRTVTRTVAEWDREVEFPEMVIV